MKSICPVVCGHCGSLFEVVTVGKQDYPDAKCPACGTVMYAVNGDARFFPRVLQRARAEEENGDFTMTILLCAVAVECEITRMYFKWSAIDENKLPHETTAADEERWEDKLRDARTVKAKLNLIATTTVKQSFDDYVRSAMHSAFLASTLTQFKSEPSTKFQTLIFNRRNKIMHAGELDFTKVEAGECRKATDALLQLLMAMDEVRFRAM